MEHLWWVDEDDKPIEKASRDECHMKRLRHRSVYVLVLNSRGEIFVQKRSIGKDLYPGFFTGSTTGHVSYGESYEEAAYRELKEELGIEAPLRYLGKFKTDSREEVEVSALYLCIFDDQPKIDEKEIEEGAFMSLKQLEEEIRHGRRPFTPGFIRAVEEIERKEISKNLEGKI